MLPTAREHLQISLFPQGSKESVALEEKRHQEVEELPLSPIVRRSQGNKNVLSSPKPQFAPPNNVFSLKPKPQQNSKDKHRPKIKVSIKQKASDQKKTIPKMKQVIIESPVQDEFRSSSLSVSSEGIEMKQDIRSEDEAEPCIRDIATLKSCSPKNLQSGISQNSFSEMVDRVSSKLRMNISLGKSAGMSSARGSPGRLEAAVNSPFSNFGENIQRSAERESNRGIDESHRVDSLMSHSVALNNTLILKHQQSPEKGKNLNLTMGALYKFNATENSICFGDANKYSEFYQKMKSQFSRGKVKPVNILDELGKGDSIHTPAFKAVERSKVRRPSRSVRGTKEAGTPSISMVRAGTLDGFSSSKAIKLRIKYSKAKESGREFAIEPKKIKCESSNNYSEGHGSDVASGLNFPQSGSQESEHTVRRQHNDSNVARKSNKAKSRFCSAHLIVDKDVSLPTVRVCHCCNDAIQEDLEDMDSSSQSEANIVPLKYKEVRGLYKQHAELTKGDLNVSLPCLKQRIPIASNSGTQNCQSPFIPIQQSPTTNSQKIIIRQYKVQATARSSRKSLGSQESPKLVAASQKISRQLAPI